MRETVMLGVGMHRFGRFPEKTQAAMARDAIMMALQDSGVRWSDVQIMFCGHSYGGIGAGGNVVDQLGMIGIPVLNVEMGCAGGAAALGLASRAVAAGTYDIACAVGFEKMPKGILPAENFPEWMRVTGMGNYPVMLSLFAQRYMKEYGVTKEQLAKVSIKSHNNASLCSYAHYPNNRNMTVEDVLNSRKICDPFTVMQIAPVSDGAAAAIICAKDAAKKYQHRKPITIAASVIGTGLRTSPHGVLSAHDDVSKGGKVAAQQAYEIAGCGPEDVDIAQVEDAYTMAELDSCRVLGLCAEDEVGKLVDEGATEINGRIPVNTDGGMLSRGNCIGACALASIAETVWQLRGEAGPRQVADPRIGIVYATGIGPSVTATILKK